MANPSPNTGLALLHGDGLPTVVFPANSDGLYLGQKYENDLTGDLYVLRVVAAGDKNLRADWRWVGLVVANAAEVPATIQRGTVVLGANGVSAAIPATITATSRILATYKAPPAPGAGTVGTLVADTRIIGGGGSFIIRALDSAGAASAAFVGAEVDWAVIN